MDPFTHVSNVRVFRKCLGILENLSQVKVIRKFFFVIGTMLSLAQVYIRCNTCIKFGLGLHQILGVFTTFLGGIADRNTV